MIKMKIRKELLWDYDLDKTPQDEHFNNFYISRVLTDGGDRDIRDIGKEMIKERLPKLHLRPPIRAFWEWYFSEGGSTGNSFGSSQRDSSVSR